ncbi:hypothetical protein Trydic_g12432 [Trypoxylus dichotomus]
MVAPLKALTIPRLELCTALFLSQQMQKVTKILNMHVNKIYYWTDSTIVLTWIRTPSRQLKTFVANRIPEIRNATFADEWNHISAIEKSDLGSVNQRGSPQQLLHNNLWRHNPSWMLQDKLMQLAAIISHY